MQSAVEEFVAIGKLPACEGAPGWPLAEVLGDADNEWIAILRERASLSPAHVMPDTFVK